MHCPKCGDRVESDIVSFCSRCGQTLDLVRAAMNADAGPDDGLERRRSGVNLGVTLMFAASIPIAATAFTSIASLPAAFLMLAAAYGAVLFGSGRLVKALRSEEAQQRTLRQEVSFGSTLMFVGLILATCMVALVPVQWAAVALIAALPAMFIAVLASSRWISDSFREILGSESAKLPARTRGPAPTTTELKPAPVQMAAGLKIWMDDRNAPSVTENTTRLLQDD